MHLNNFTWPVTNFDWYVSSIVVLLHNVLILNIVNASKCMIVEEKCPCRVVFKPYVFVKADMAIPLQPGQHHNHPPAALHCDHCNVPALVFRCYNCYRLYCGRCVWMHGAQRLLPDADAEEADEVAEGMHALWLRAQQRVAGTTASDPARAAVVFTRQCA